MEMKNLNMLTAALTDKMTEMTGDVLNINKAVQFCQCDPVAPSYMFRSCRYACLITSRGFEPFAGPTMPRASISSIRRAARL